MKVPLSWLKTLITLHQTAEDIGNCLTQLGIEVEGVAGGAANFSGVVVGKVLSSAKHPNADLLRIARVTDGEKEYQIVCGAPNCREGIVVALARIGAHLKEDDGKSWTIKKSKIRGAESEGMLCTAKELRLSNEHEGILELPSDAPLGMDVGVALLDPVFDLSLTPNLGHCLSILGIARELAASFNQPVHIPKPVIQVSGNEKVNVSVENGTACPRFTCRIIRNVEIKASPPWIQKRLSQCGIRCINNVVDITNYVMLELGQPLHVFDLDQIRGPKLVVKFADISLQFETLDGMIRQIPPHTLMIYDEHQPISIAGIMGGKSSAATEKTQNIIIEAAYFNPAAIRKTSRLLDLKTDASVRFDRGVDQEAVMKALDLATELIQQCAGGTIHPATDCHLEPFKAKTIALKFARVQKILGFSISLSEATLILKKLNMHVVASENSETLHVTPPSYRHDLNIEEDLIEEIARLYGYHNISLIKFSPRYSSGSLKDSPIFSLEEQVRLSLLKEGLQECITCDLISPTENELAHEKGLPAASTLRVLHPRSIDQSALRSSLLPGLLKVVEHNFNHGQNNLALFEMGRIHFREKDRIEEPSCIGIILTGASRHLHFDRKPSPFDFFDLKGILENLIHSLYLKQEVQFSPSNLHTLHPYQQAQLNVGDVKIGVFGQLHPHLKPKQLLPQETILFAELNLIDIFKLEKERVAFHPLPSTPSSIRDWTVTLPSHISFTTISTLIGSCLSKFVESFEMIDSFSSPQLGPDQKNITFRFVYRDLNQTISHATVEEEHRIFTHFMAEKLDNLV